MTLWVHSSASSTWRYLVPDKFPAHCRSSPALSLLPSCALSKFLKPRKPFKHVSFAATLSSFFLPPSPFHRHSLSSLIIFCLRQSFTELCIPHLTRSQRSRPRRFPVLPSSFTFFLNPAPTFHHGEIFRPRVPVSPIRHDT